MTNQDPITVPEGTNIHTAYAKNTKIEADRWDYFGIARGFTTTIEFHGNIPIDLTKPVYILQFDDDEENPQ